MINVLIADDHAVFREGLREIFDGLPDIAVTGEAKDSQEVLERVRENDYDVVLLDISMPGRGGIDITKEIIYVNPRIAVLILSMHREEEFAVRAIRAGARGYLTKESKSGEVIQAIRKVASGGVYVSDVVAEKLAGTVRNGRKGLLHEDLSDREHQVMVMLASGKTINRIADELSLSPSTISTYKYRILEKMNIESIAELVRYAIKNKLLPNEDSS